MFETGRKMSAMAMLRQLFDIYGARLQGGYTRTVEHLLFPQVTGKCDSCCECSVPED
jgi:hypothetical protein